MDLSMQKSIGVDKSLQYDSHRETLLLSCAFS